MVLSCGSVSALSKLASVAALRTLRQLPNGSDTRERLIGFGDPIFSRAQAEEAARDAEAPIQVAATTRGLPLKRRSSPQLEGVDSAELALLPRLPDTAEELKSIALALEVDPVKRPRRPAAVASAMGTRGHPQKFKTKARIADAGQTQGGISSAATAS